MGTSSPVFEKDRADSVAAGVAEALAASAEQAMADDQWTARWDAVGLRQPHDPVTGYAWSGINRYALIAGRTVIDGAVTGAWATRRDWAREGFAVEPGSPGIVVLQAEFGTLGAVTVYNACQLTEDGPADARYEFPPKLGAADIDRLFGAVGVVVCAEEEPQHRASQLADMAVAQAGATLGRPASWQDPGEALVGVLASQIVVNALGFSYLPECPSPDVIEEWCALLRSPDGGHDAMVLTAGAAQTAAAVVEQIAARQIETPSVAAERAVAAEGAVAAERAVADISHSFID